MLHSNRELFEQAILRTADATGIAASIIEKDYYVTEFLRRMTSYQPDDGVSHQQRRRSHGVQGRNFTLKML